MRLINYTLLALGLVVMAGCGKQEAPATEAVPATAEAPAPVAAPEAPAPAADGAATTAPTEGSVMDQMPAPDSAAAVTGEASAMACPTGCKVMNCPPPGGARVCCKQTSTGYQKC